MKNYLNGLLALALGVGLVQTVRATPVVSQVSVDSNAVRVFPNPWRVDANGGSDITFDHLPAGAAVKIFTISGHWVRTLSASGAAASWDLKNHSGDSVASGVYLYVIKSGSENKTGKIVVIK